jgi:hypothetical protein
MNGLVAGMGLLAGLAMCGRRHRGQLSELGLTDEQHAGELLHHVENAYQLMNEAESALSKRKSTGNCRTAYRSLKTVLMEAAVAHENLKAMQSNRSRYDAVISNLSTDYDALIGRTTKRCGLMRLEPAKRRKCVRWGKKGKKRYCKRYSTSRTR